MTPDPARAEAERRAFERGAWFAFDAVLGWINTLDAQVLDKGMFYRAVRDMRPDCIARWRGGTGESSG